MFQQEGLDLKRGVRMSKNRPLTFYEFFAGVGLAKLGLGPSWNCLWANDFDPKKAKTYISNFGDAEFVLGDVATIEPLSLPEKADMAWASFPCQDLSLAGWRRGMSAERSGTFWAFWRIMRDLFDEGRRPPLIVIENVKGLLYGDYFNGLCESLAALGMRFGAMVIDAKHFLPQSRPRVFVVAVDQEVDCSQFITENREAPWFPEALLSAYNMLTNDLKELWNWWSLPMPDHQVCSVSELIEDEPQGVSWHTPEETEHILNLMNENNRRKVNSAVAIDKRMIGLIYRRTRDGMQRAEVRFDGIAGCLRTPQGGSSRQTVLVVESGKIRSRLLSPRECARLMGVSDSFWLPSKYNDAYKAMGDGVAVPAVAWLAEYLLAPIAVAASLKTVNRPSKYHVRLADFRVNAEASMALWEANC